MTSTGPPTSGPENKIKTIVTDWSRRFGQWSGLAHLSIRWKLVGTVLILALLVAATGIIGLNAMTRVGATSETVYEEQMPVARAASDLRLVVEKERSAIQAYLRGDASAKQRYIAAKQKFNQIYTRISSKETLTAEERELLKQIQTKHEHTTQFAEAAMKARDNENWATMSGELSSYRSNQQRLITLTEEFRSAAEKDMSQSLTAAERVQQQSQQMLIGLTILAFVLAIVIGLLVARHIIGPIKRLSDTADRIAQGQLDTDITDTQRRDELGGLTDSFRAMQTYLETVAKQATAIAEQRFQASVLDETVPGDFGNTIDQLSTDVREAQREIETVNQALETKAADYSSTMKKAAAGDLTVRMDSDSQSDAMEQVGEAFNDMMNELSDTIAHIREFSTEVAAASQEVTSIADEINNASQQVSESIQEISAGTDEEYEQLQETSNEMQTLSGTIEEVASSANQVASVSDQAAERAERGTANANQAIEEMNAIQTETDQTVAEVESLAEEIDQISEIVELITDITEQTNQLALNASIEAARAGEAGEGFAVVADEVKELAQEAGDATKEIEALIDEIRTSTETAVEDIRSMDDSVSTGLETVEEALTAMDEMADDIDEVNQSVQEIDTVTDEQASSTEEVVTMVEKVAEISEENSNEAESVSAAAEEQTSSLNEVTDRVDELASRAQQLQELLAAFELGGEASSSDLTPAAAADSQSGTVAASDSGNALTD